MIYRKRFIYLNEYIFVNFKYSYFNKFLTNFNNFTIVKIRKTYSTTLFKYIKIIYLIKFLVRSGDRSVVVRLPDHHARGLGFKSHYRRI